MKIEEMTVDDLIYKIDLNNKESKIYNHLLCAMIEWGFGEDESVNDYYGAVKLLLGIEEININELESSKNKIEFNRTNDKLESVCELIIFLKLRNGESIVKPKKWFEFWKN